jgi:hypothetical protein
MSVFTPVNTSAAFTSSSVTQGAVYSGNLEHYLPSIIEALDAWDGSTDIWVDVNTAMDSAFNGLHYFLTHDDLELLATLVNFTASSAEDWAAYPYSAYAFYQSGEEFDIVDPYPMSIFFTGNDDPWYKRLWRNARRVALKDLEGFLAGWLESVITEPSEDGSHHLDQGTDWGVGASVGAAVCPLFHRDCP